MGKYELSEIYGAKAKVYMKYEGKIDELTKIISDKILIPEFNLEYREEPPYDMTAMSELLGFEVWLEHNNEFTNYDYSIRIETEDCENEIFKGNMYDISLWFARFISRRCSIETLVKCSGNEIKFLGGKSF